MKLGDGRALAWLGAVGNILFGLFLYGLRDTPYLKAFFLWYGFSLLVMAYGCWLVLKEKHRSWLYIFALFANMIGFIVIMMLPPGLPKSENDGD